MRTTAREVLFKIVFASQFNEIGELKSALFKAEKLDDNDKKYCEDLLKIIDEHKAEFAETIDKKSRLFPEQSLFPADRSVLFISLAEIKYYGIPVAVSINEAANISSKYSSEKSASFVSGILSEICKEL